MPPDTTIATIYIRPPSVLFFMAQAASPAPAPKCLIYTAAPCIRVLSLLRRCRRRRIALIGLCTILAHNRAKVGYIVADHIQLLKRVRLWRVGDLGAPAAPVEHVVCRQHHLYACMEQANA